MAAAKQALQQLESNAAGLRELSLIEPATFIRPSLLAIIVILSGANGLAGESVHEVEKTLLFARAGEQACQIILAPDSFRAWSNFIKQVPRFLTIARPIHYLLLGMTSWHHAQFEKLAARPGSA